jgi:hypothetical protein
MNYRCQRFDMWRPERRHGQEAAENTDAELAAISPTPSASFSRRDAMLGKDSTTLAWIPCFSPCLFHGTEQSHSMLDVFTGSMTANGKFASTTTPT